jgi:hypothetical protein
MTRSSAPEEQEVEQGSAVKQSLPGKPPARISVQQLRISQPSYTQSPITAGQKNEPFAGDILGDTPFVLEARFTAQLEATNGNDLEKYNYHAEFYARDRSSGRNLFLGDSAPQMLSADESNYVAILPELVLQAGVYRIQVLVSVETTPPARGYLSAQLLYVS